MQDQHINRNQVPKSGQWPTSPVDAQYILSQNGQIGTGAQFTCEEEYTIHT